MTPSHIELGVLSKDDSALLLEYGIFRSDDEGQTWKQIGKFPLNSIDFVKSVSGDMNIYGRVYVGFSGSGFAYADTN